MATRRWQTTAALAQGLLSLPGSRYHLHASMKVIPSPYFQTTDPRKEAPGRDTHQSLTSMDFLIDSMGVSGGNPYIVLSWWNSSNVFQSSDIVFLTMANIKASGVSATVTTAVNAYAATNSLTVSSIRNLPQTLSGMPQGAIADAPADAVTNYNTVTTLLGAVTGAVNTANTKQNDIATKLNTLFAELRTLGVIAA